MTLSNSLCVLALAVAAAYTSSVGAAPHPSSSVDVPVIDNRAAEICYDGESAKLLCYRAPGGTPQHVDIADVNYIGAYLRHYGRQNPNKPGFYTMNAADTPDCTEWGIDGGGAGLATDATKATAIIGCPADGGSLGVLANTSNPAYQTDVC